METNDYILLFKIFLEDNNVIEEFNDNFYAVHKLNTKLSDFLKKTCVSDYILGAFDWGRSININHNCNSHEAAKFWGNLSSEWRDVARKISIIK